MYIVVVECILCTGMYIVVVKYLLFYWNVYCCTGMISVVLEYILLYWNIWL